ncbi:MAG TPA: hypothetical protein VGV89_06010 [Thermoplasmata archaeon]|nr:hypothetical protein [Thermoplasmata archaeon]
MATTIQLSTAKRGLLKSLGKKGETDYVISRRLLTVWGYVDLMEGQCKTLQQAKGRSRLQDLA